MRLKQDSKIEFVTSSHLFRLCDILVDGTYFVRIYKDGEVYVNNTYSDGSQPWLKYSSGEEALEDFKSVFGS